MYRLIVQHVLAFGNVTLSGGLIEFSSAMGTLNVIAVIANRRRWQIAELPSCGQVCLHLLRRAYGVNEILVFATPVRLHLRLLRSLELLLSESFLNERLKIGSPYAIHHCIERLSLLLPRLCANLLVKGYPVLSETTTAHFTRNQIVCGNHVSSAFARS